MYIPRVDFVIFGYRKITVADADVKSAAKRLFSLGISLKLCGTVFFVGEKDFLRVKKSFDGRIEYTASHLLGLRGFIMRRKHSFGIFAGAAIGMLLIFLSSLVVWDVRVEGSEGGYESEIVEELRDAGFSVGTFWNKVDKSVIEARVLSSSDIVGWININRRGTVAYVSVIDKTVYEEQLPKRGYANIVAERDGVIEEISVRQGYALVTAGETVRKGQILISGVPPVGVTGDICYADGTVIARYSGQITVEIPRSESVKVLQEKKMLTFSLNFFGKNINIFKKYGKTAPECVIIKDIRDISLINGKNLPLKTVREYAYIYKDSVVTHTDSEMTAAAENEHSEKLRALLLGATLYRIKTSGEFTENSYVFQSEYLCASDIGRALEFEADTK